MNNIKRIYGIVSLITLFIGIVLYLLFRELNNMVILAYLPKITNNFNTVLIPLQSSLLNNFIKYHLPDMLWFISAILFLRFIWFYNIKVQTIYIMIFYLIGIIFETSQLSKKVYGTFDWFDLLFMGIAAFVEGLLYKYFIRRRLK